MKYNNFKISIAENNDTFNRAIRFLNDKKIFQFDKINRNWEYSFKKNKVLIYIIESNNKIIAIWSHFIIQLYTGNKKILSGMGENVYIMKEHRGRSLDVMLYKYSTIKLKQNGVDIIWTFTSVYNLLKYKFGAYYFKNSIILTRIQIGFIGINNIKKEYPKKRLLFKYFNKLFIFVHNSIRMQVSKWYLKNHYSIINEGYNYNKISEFVEMLISKYRNFIYLDINNDFYDWRIRRNPNYKYKFYYLYKNGNIKGYLVSAIKNNKFIIVDFLCIDDEASKVLFIKSIHLARIAKNNYIEFYLNNSFFLNSSLFKQLDKFRPIFLDKLVPPMVINIINSFDFDCNYIKNKKYWHINGLWKLGYDF